ncbi:MAG: hypothetical protein IKP75_08670 [Oscillospiraceae bacterium]|nr:hypothetical protein [Oscillospiraceae bacterium]
MRKKILGRIISAVTAVVLSGAAPAAGGTADILRNTVVFAEESNESVKYLDREWTKENGITTLQKTCTEYTKLSNLSDSIGVAMEDGWYVVDKNITFNNRLGVLGDVHLIIRDGCTLTCKDGIRLATKNFGQSVSTVKLSIYSQSDGSSKGILKADATSDGNGSTGKAGIGGSKEENGGTVSIYGGDITAKGENFGAGIGGGKDANGGIVNIYGGIVKADAGSEGAAIGGGIHGTTSWVENGSGINIYGGETYATGHGFGAGIGSGQSSADDKRPENSSINIYGGYVEANAEVGGAAIGGGAHMENPVIYIHDGVVRAEAAEIWQDSNYYGAGIGSGSNAPYTNKIFIYDGLVFATSSDGAGIGSGRETPGGDIYIDGGYVTAIAESGGAAIGSGRDADNGYVLIEGGTVIAVSEMCVEKSEYLKHMISYYSPASNKGKMHSIESQKILMGVDAIGMGIALGIGWIADLIHGSKDVCGAAIGGGHEGSGGTVTITGGSIDAYSGMGSANAIGHGKGASDSGKLTIGDGLTVYSVNGKVETEQSDDGRFTFKANAVQPVHQLSADRESACRSNRYVSITPCGHNGSVYTPVNERIHHNSCDYCVSGDGNTLHTFDDNDDCTKCGYGFYLVALYPQNDNDNDHVQVIKASKDEPFTVPECTFTAPEGKSFCWWNCVTPGKYYNKHYTKGDEIQLDGAIALRAVWGDVYPLWVNGVQVTYAHQDDILGDGTVSYDPSLNRLILKNAVITQSSNDAAIYCDGLDLTVGGIGTVDSQTARYGIYVKNGSLAIDGSITATGSECGMYTTGTLKFLSGTARACGSADAARADVAIELAPGYTVTSPAGAAVSTDGKYIAGIAGENGNHAADATVTLGLWSITYIYGDDDDDQYKHYTAQTEPGEAISVFVPGRVYDGKIFRCWHSKDDDDTVYYEGDSIVPVRDMTLTAQWAYDYGVKIGSVAVTETNRDDVLGDGHVRFDPDTRTLTLDVPNGESIRGIRSDSELTIVGKAVINEPSDYGIYVTEGDLTLNGDFAVSGGSDGIYVTNGSLFINGGSLIAEGKIGITVFKGDIEVNDTTAITVRSTDNTIKRAVKLKGELILAEKLRVTEPESYRKGTQYIEDVETGRYAERVVIAPDENYIGERLAGHSLSLDGAIGVNFYMELTPEAAQDPGAYVLFTFENGAPDQTAPIDTDNTWYDTATDKTYYIFGCTVAAKEMNDKISAQLFAQGKAGRIYEYTVCEYGRYILDHSDDYDYTTATVAQAMLDYGSAAQVYFGKDTALPSGDYLDRTNYVDVSDIEASEPVHSLPEDITFEGATLTLRSETSLSLYFLSETELSFSNDTYEVEKAYVTEDGKRYQVARIRGIKAEDLGKAVTLTVNGTYTIRYSPMYYCRLAISKNAREADLCRALFLFKEASEAYQLSHEA